MRICGDCKHWQQPADEYSGEDGTCLYYVNNIPPDMPPAPFWAKQEKVARNVMYKTSAKTILCKVFEAAELLTPNAEIRGGEAVALNAGLELGN